MSNNNGLSPAASNATDLNREGNRIQELVGQIQDLHDPGARAMLEECLEATLSFYGHGLERILQIVEKAEAGGKKVRDALLQDGGVSGLLLIHGLHPIPLEKRLGDALDRVRPYMKSHGGDVELLTLENEHAVLRLNGHCKTCPSSTVTMELAVRHAIEEACPDLDGFEVEGAAKIKAESNGSSFVHTPNAEPEWTRVEKTAQLRDGGFMTVPTKAESLLICRIEDQLYAYRDRCPGCNMPLHLGHLEEGTLTCGLGHHFDARHAGAGLDASPLHLEPVPLLVQEGEVKVALTRVAPDAHASLTEVS